MKSGKQTDIQHFERSAIDDERWDDCVERMGLPYVHSWYLDIVTEKNWNGLIYGDYEAVLPLPYNRKLLGFYQVYQPILSQQSGVCGTTDSSIISALIAAIPAQYRRVYISLQASQAHLLKNTTARERTNLVLSLERPYTEIRQQYSKSLRKRIRKAGEVQSFELSGNLEELVQLYRQEIGDRLEWGSEQFDWARQLIQTAINQQKGLIASVKAASGETTAISFFLVSHGRVINLFGASSAEGKAQFAMHLLLDGMIQHFAESDKQLFDFEGSEIPGVATFFRSFGATAEVYAVYERNTLPRIINWLLNARERLR